MWSLRNRFRRIGSLVIVPPWGNGMLGYGMWTWTLRCSTPSLREEVALLKRSGNGRWSACWSTLPGPKFEDYCRASFSSPNGQPWNPGYGPERVAKAWLFYTKDMGNSLACMRNDWEQLYLLQDWVLTQLRPVKQSFYLTGGTALSRGYYEHRYSEDLDFFLNDAADFQLARDRCLSGLQQAVVSKGWKLEIILREERFGRAFVHGPIPLKLEFINDVPFRVGHPWEHSVLGLLDTKENILANKLSALLDRQEPKDLADIFWLCCRDKLDLVDAIEQAGGKAAGVFPPAIARALAEGLPLGVPKVVWRQPPSEQEFKDGLNSLIRRIVD